MSQLLFFNSYFHLQVCYHQSQFGYKEAAKVYHINIQITFIRANGISKDISFTDLLVLSRTWLINSIWIDHSNI